VLLAMGHDEQRARASLRFSLGHTSTASDVDCLVEAIAPVVERARSAAGPVDARSVPAVAG
jgi:cysteine desulfurase